MRKQVSVCIKIVVMSYANAPHDRMAMLWINHNTQPDMNAMRNQMPRQYAEPNVPIKTAVKGNKLYKDWYVGKAKITARIANGYAIFAPL